MEDHKQDITLDYSNVVNNLKRYHSIYIPSVIVHRAKKIVLILFRFFLQFLDIIVTPSTLPEDQALVFKTFHTLIMMLMSFPISDEIFYL